MGSLKIGLLAPPWATVSPALANGYDFIRLSADARWWVAADAPIEDLFRYESEFNRFTGLYPQAGCLYE